MGEGGVGLSPVEAEREEVNLGIGYCQKNVYIFLTIDF